jgi:hypothetical protein
MKVYTGDFADEGRDQVLFVKQSSLHLYVLSEAGMLRHLRSRNMFSNIRSSQILLKSRPFILLACDTGVLHLIDDKLEIVDSFAYSRSGSSLSTPGYHLSANRLTCMILPIRGLPIFLNLSPNISSPIALDSKSVFLDSKPSLESENLYTLEVTKEGRFCRTYEYINETVVERAKLEVDTSSYMIVPLPKDYILLCSEAFLYLIKHGTILDSVKTPSIDSKRLLFVSHDSLVLKSKNISLILLCSENGDLFKVSINDNAHRVANLSSDTKQRRPSPTNTGVLMLTFYDKINPSKSISISRSGFIVSVGVKESNDVYHIQTLGKDNYWESEGDNFRRETHAVKKVDSIAVFNYITNSVITENLLLYSCNDSIRKIIKSDLTYYSGFNKDGIEKVFLSGGALFLVMEKGVLEFDIKQGDRTLLSDPINTHTPNLNTAITNVFIVGDFRVFVYKNEILVQRDEFTLEEKYDDYGYDDQTLVVLHENRVIILISGNQTVRRVINISYKALGLEVSGKYFFILTSRNILRVYDTNTMKYTFIQAVERDIRTMIATGDMLHIIVDGEIRTYGFLHGMLSDPIVRKIESEAFNTKRLGGELLIIYSRWFYIVNKGLLKVEAGFKDLIVYKGKGYSITESCSLKMFKLKDKYERFTYETIREEKDREFILRDDKYYIENGRDGPFKIVKFDGGLVVGGNGRAIDYVIEDEYLFLLAIKDEQYVIQTFKDNKFLYENVLEGRCRGMIWFNNRLACGVMNRIVFYDLGKKRLLRKREIRGPSRVTDIKAMGQRIYIGTAEDSILVYNDKCELIAEDCRSRRVVCFEIVDYDTVIGCDKFGNVFILKVVNEKILECKCTVYIGDVVSGFCIYGKRMMYLCVGGRIGELILVKSSDFEIYEILEEELNKRRGDDFYKFMDTFTPRKGIVDGSYLKCLRETNRVGIPERIGLRDEGLIALLDGI